MKPFIILLLTICQLSAQITYKSEYQPTTFKVGGHVKGVKSADLQDMNYGIMPKKENGKKSK